MWSSGSGSGADVREARKLLSDLGLGYVKILAKARG